MTMENKGNNKITVSAEVVPPENTQDTIVLRMPREVAETLRAVCFNIGGNQKTSRRGHMDCISEALCAAKVSLPQGYRGMTHGSIFF